MEGGKVTRPRITSESDSKMTSQNGICVIIALCLPTHHPFWLPAIFLYILIILIIDESNAAFIFKFKPSYTQLTKKIDFGYIASYVQQALLELGGA